MESELKLGSKTGGIWANVTGLEDLQRKLMKLPQFMADYEQAAIKDGAKIIETEMKNRAPEYKGDRWDIPPGFLRNSINTLTNAKSANMGAAEFMAWIGPAVKLQYPTRFVETHRKKLKKASAWIKKLSLVERAGMTALAVARFMEHGTYNKSAHAFIRPALEAVRSKVQDAMARRLKDGVDKASTGNVR